MIIFTPCPTLLSIWEMEVAVTLSWMSTIGSRWLVSIVIIVRVIFSTIILTYLREAETRLQRRPQERMQRRCQGFHSGLLPRGRGLWTGCIGYKFERLRKSYQSVRDCFHAAEDCEQAALDTWMHRIPRTGCQQSVNFEAFNSIWHNVRHISENFVYYILQIVTCMGYQEKLGRHSG